MDEQNVILEKPNSNGNVWPNQVCPGFCARDGTKIHECWYCKYADFHLTQGIPLKVGICYFPKKII